MEESNIYKRFLSFFYKNVLKCLQMVFSVCMTHAATYLVAFPWFCLLSFPQKERKLPFVPKCGWDQKCLTHCKTLTCAKPGEGHSRGLEPRTLTNPGPWHPRLGHPGVLTHIPCAALGFFRPAYTHPGKGIHMGPWAL